MACAATSEQEVTPGEVETTETSFGMDLATNAMLFAEELVDYVLQKLGYAWVCKSGARALLATGAVEKRFTPEIGEAVFDIIFCHIELIADGYKQLQRKNINSVEDFRRELCISTTFYLYNGYDPERFLTLCAHFVGMAAFYFENGNTKIADASAQVLAYLLNFFIYQCAFNVTTDWFQLCLYAQMIRREVKANGKLERVLPVIHGLPKKV